MPRTSRSWALCLPACVVLLALTGGCGTPTLSPDVGAVVVAPMERQQPAPQVVQETEPKPAGYFLQSFLDYFRRD